MMDAHIGTGRPPCEAWRGEVERSPDVESLLGTVRRYLGLWSPEALLQLPMDLGGSAIPGRDAIYARAFLATQAELRMNGEDPRHAALREMALVMSAAASRLRVLESYAAVSRVRPSNLVVPRGPQGELEAVVRGRGTS